MTILRGCKALRKVPQLQILTSALELPPSQSRGFLRNIDLVAHLENNIQTIMYYRSADRIVTCHSLGD